MKTPISKTDLAAMLLEELRCLDGAEQATSRAFSLVRDESVDFDWIAAPAIDAMNPEVELHFITVVVPAYQLRFTLAPDDCNPPDAGG